MKQENVKSAAESTAESTAAKTAAGAANKAETGAPSQTGNIIVSVVMAAIGLIFIWMYDKGVITPTVVFIGALAFIIPGAAVLMQLLVRRKDKQRATVMSLLAGICAVAAVGLGIVILVRSGSFEHLLVFLFGALLIMAAIWQFDIMLRKNRGVLYPAWLVIAPVLIVALGVVLCAVDFFHAESNEKWMLLASGCGFTIYGIIGLFISYFAVRERHLAKKAAKDSTIADSADSSSKADSISATAVSDAKSTADAAAASSASDKSSDNKGPGSSFV